MVESRTDAIQTKCLNLFNELRGKESNYTPIFDNDNGRAFSFKHEGSSAVLTYFTAKDKTPEMFKNFCSNYHDHVL